MVVVVVVYRMARRWCVQPVMLLVMVMLHTALQTEQDSLTEQLLQKAQQHRKLKDYSTALTLLEETAQQGDDQALFFLGQMYQVRDWCPNV